MSSNRIPPIPETLGLPLGLRLDSFSHRDRESGVCLMEAAAWLARLAHTDRPSCVCKTLIAYGIAVNDRLPSELRVSLLTPLVPRLVGTNDDGHALERARMAVEWATRVGTPLVLEMAGQRSAAAALRTHQRATSATFERAEIAIGGHHRGSQRALSRCQRANQQLEAGAPDAAVSDAAAILDWVPIGADTERTEALWRSAAACLERMTEIGACDRGRRWAELGLDVLGANT